MCGIYGVLSVRDHGKQRDVLSAMGGIIPHRGPDDEGQYIGEGVALGIRRLSIIDLVGGHQPIPNEDRSIWAICNGEIYNFRELRKDLESKGHRFSTNSDTEVLVHLYEQDGVDFLKRLRGMFAIALWDVRRRRLILARDRLGKKPLYIRQTTSRILFASEIKSLLTIDDTCRAVDHVALAEYLDLGFVPAPRTMFAGVSKLLPGHFLLIENDQVRQAQYWDVDFSRIEHRSEREWIALVRQKLEEAVRIRLVSDVPVGAFLSGGIDSSMIVAIMAKHLTNRVKTYSVGFSDQDSFYNELSYAETVARHVHSDHHEILVKPDSLDLLPKLAWHLDEPIADSAAIVTYIVSMLARDSATVLLSGIGGDELFGGYRRYLGGSIHRYYKLLPSVLRERALPGLVDRLPQDRHSDWKNTFRYARAFIDTADLPNIHRYLSYIRVFSPELRSQVLRSNGLETRCDMYASYIRQSNCDDELNQLIYADLKTSLPDDLLVLTDKMTMAASLECRVPFIDHELVELTARIPSNLKVRGMTTKYLLKKVAEGWLPSRVIQRRKRGFGAPIGSWLRRDESSLVRDTLSASQIKKRGLFDAGAIQEIVAEHCAKQVDHTDRLLALINFELWYQLFIDGDDWKRYGVQKKPSFHALAV